MKASDLQFADLLKSIDEYRKKYYQNQLFKGSLFAVALLLSLFLLVNTIEYFGRFNSLVRGILFFSYLTAFAYVTYRWVLSPLLFLSGITKPISDEDAARQIGQFFPSIGDKLLNALQLESLGSGQSDLIQASINQKSSQLLVVRFSEAINFAENSRYFKYAAYPLAILALILFFKPSFLSSSSERLLRFNANFEDIPFEFVLANQDLKVFRNEDFKVKLNLKGHTLPDQVFLISNNTRFKLIPDATGQLSYTFKSLQKDVTFHFEAAGYHSQKYKIQLVDKPGLLSFDVQLTYPNYLGKPSESLSNIGNFTVPEGTKVRWRFKTISTESATIEFDNDSTISKGTQKNSNLFEIDQVFKKSTGYRISLVNENMPEGEQVNYFASVIPDQYPQLSAENFQDSTLYNYVVVGGNVSDDYGISQLKLFYDVTRKGEENRENPHQGSIPVSFNRQANNQSYYFEWFLDSLKLEPGDRLEYYAQVWDNDGVNGPKSTRSRSLLFSIPDREQIASEISKSVEETQEELEKAALKAKELEKKLRELENKLKANNELDFQEQKMAEEILKKREELLQQIKSLQEKNQLANDKAKQFNKQSDSYQKKMDELQKLMNELMQDESSKLYEELEKLSEQKQSERMSKLLERLRNKEKNTEKELDRTLNLFKRLQMEQKIESAVENLKELADEQEKLAEKTQKENGRSEEIQEELAKQQEKIEEDFNDIREQLEDIEKIGEDIDRKQDTQKEAQKSASEAQKDSKQQLRNKQNKKASESQKKAEKAMREIAQNMEEAMEASGSMEMQEDMDALRDILENLHILSFDQEQLMKDFKGVHLSDPRFVELGQKQLKLQDDSKIIEDSLYSLASRVMEIESFVTREVNNMNYYMDQSIQFIRERKLPLVGSHQQFAMTSINNLALMLSDVFSKMQQAMAAMMMPGQGKKPGGSPGQMQDELNKKMGKMSKTSGEGEQTMSEQLARMAAEQAAIREMVKKMLEGQKGNEFDKNYGQELKDIIEQMEKSETDIVNKRISQELLERNEKMLTRLLESEKALREQDEDEERKGEAARQTPRRPSPAFQEYLQSKSMQTELLRTVPPNFTPFYKKEVDSYFQSSAAEH